MQDLLNKKSMMISSLNVDGIPQISYAPFVLKETTIYLYLSKMADHYQNLTVNPKCSVMAIEDEEALHNIFARKRVSFKCAVRKLETVDSNIEILYAKRHGERNYDHIKQAHGFDWFELTIEKGRLVEGFGKASDIFVESEELKLVPITADRIKKSRKL